MNEIIYLVGDATRPIDTDSNRIIAHVCNDRGGWGAGFVLAISKRWTAPEKKYRALKNYVLGEVQFVKVESGLNVANMIAQTLGWKNGNPPIRYEALRKCLEKVFNLAHEHHATVHMPRIGAGLAGGKWNKIEAMIEDELVARGIPVFVYDLPN